MKNTQKALQGCKSGMHIMKTSCAVLLIAVLCKYCLRWDSNRESQEQDAICATTTFTFCIPDQIIQIMVQYRQCLICKTFWAIRNEQLIAKGYIDPEVSKGIIITSVTKVKTTHNCTLPQKLIDKQMHLQLIRAFSHSRYPDSIIFNLFF